MVLDQVRAADAGLFKITDILGFTVSSTHLEIQRKGWHVCMDSSSAVSLTSVCCGKLLQFKHANERSAELFITLFLSPVLPP